MPDIYCPSCGFKNFFTSTRPKFCSSCGEPFSAGDASLREKKEKIMDIDEEGSDVFNVPNIANLQVDISYEGMGSVMKGSDLFQISEDEIKSANPIKSDKKQVKRRRRKGS